MNLLTTGALLGAALTLITMANAQPGEETSPGQITTRDGVTYYDVQVLRSEPDGIVISYTPRPEGIGFAKLRFSDLPDYLRGRYGYNAQQAGDYERQQNKATSQWVSHMVQDEALRRYRELALLNSSVAGEEYNSYTVSLSPDGHVSAQGFTGSMPPWLSAASLGNGYSTTSTGTTTPGNGTTTTLPSSYSSGMTPNGTSQ